MASETDIVKMLLELAAGEVPARFRTHEEYGQGIHAYRNALLSKAATFIEAQLAREAVLVGLLNGAEHAIVRAKMALSETREHNLKAAGLHNLEVNTWLDKVREILAHTSARAEAINAVVEAAKKQSGLHNEMLKNVGITGCDCFLCSALSRLALEPGNALSAKETEMEFTRDHEALLLTVARILRARIGEFASAWQDDDRAALKDALAPFGPLEGPPINEELRRRR